MKLNYFRLLVAIMIIMMVACTGRNSKKFDNLASLQGTVMGGLSSGISEESYNAMLTSLIGGPVKEVIFYNRGIDVLAALKAGKIDAYPTHQFAADYTLKRNSDIKAIPVDAEFEGGIIMAVRAEDEALKILLDSAINLLSQDGTIDKLAEDWIINLPVDQEPVSDEMAKTEGAPTYYIGVSGDFPPLDYMASDGRPAGFNVALISKISALLGVNFEFVSLETQARFAALNSKKIDVIFCHFQSYDSNYFDDLKKNNWIGTIPYYTYKKGCFIVMK